jgi:hypothetical protein
MGSLETHLSSRDQLENKIIPKKYIEVVTIVKLWLRVFNQY